MLMQVLIASKRIISLLILLMFITACNQSGTSTRVVDGDPEPPAPWGPKDALINWTEVEGVDRDQDGVRDDVEIWINNHGQDEYIRKALKQQWKAQVEFIKISETEINTDLLWKRKQEILSRAKECVHLFVATDLSNLIYNDYAMYLETIRPVDIAVAKYSERFAGMTGMAPGFYGLYIEGEKYCDFNIPHIEEIKANIKKKYFPSDYLEKLDRESFEQAKSWRQP